VTSDDGVLVSPAWVQDRIGEPGVRVIEVDAEWSDSYAAGHIPGALGSEWKTLCWDPLMREFPTPEEFARRAGGAGIRNESTVVVYGDPIPFGFYAWWVLKYCGHKDVRVLDGGRARWFDESRPLTGEVPEVTPVEYKLVPRVEGMRATRDYVLAALGRPGCVLLDGRSAEEFAGKRVNMPDKPDHGAERSGRIPGARHLNAHELLNDDGTLKRADDLKALFELRGATASREIICSYDGSWTEWGSIVGVPIER
jgi:thiosulfate/3-mercaptopyruvate sulfurtransferase